MVRLLVLHPRNWTDRRMWPKNVEVRHVSIGGKVPRRSSGIVTYDGVGEMTEPEGVEKLREQAYVACWLLPLRMA